MCTKRLLVKHLRQCREVVCAETHQLHLMLRLRVWSELLLALIVAATARADLVAFSGDLLQQLGRVVTDVLELPLGYNLQDGEEFEYVVVGAGGAGSAVAARLALAGHATLLVEAGSDPTLLSRVPAGAMALLGSPIDWQYRTLSNNMSCLGSEGQQCRFSRGKVLGGSTSINYMMYVRGNRQDYELGLPGWTWDDIEPYFLRYEGNRDLDELPESSAPYHNTSGTMRVGFCDDPENVWHDRIVKGFQELSFPFNPDVNAESQIGVTRIQTYTYKGERESTARGYLSRPDVRRVLRLAKGTRCTGVLFDDDNTATGVSVVRNLSGRTVTVRATRGVVLSAGTIGTPQLLMLSGIGPAGHLSDLGIPLRVNLPVGDSMSDHVLPLIFIRANRPLLQTLGSVAMTGVGVLKYGETRDGPLASIGLTDITAFANLSCYDFENRQLLDLGSDCELPSLQLINAYIERGLVSLASPVMKQATLLNNDIIGQLAVENARNAFIVASPVVLAPFSRGWVRLASSDPLEEPAIFPNYLGDERDVDEMVRSITLLEHLVETKPYRSLDASIIRLKLPDCPEYQSDRLGYWRCYVRYLTFSVYHAAGTCSLGRVLDPGLGVIGTRRLHVADLSALPRVPHGNTAAAAIALGERLADFLTRPREN